jgi:hypothetical protein
MLQESWAAYTDQKAVLRTLSMGSRCNYKKEFGKGFLSNIPHMAEMCVR